MKCFVDRSIALTLDLSEDEIRVLVDLIDKRLEDLENEEGERRENN